jgi:hypothetical protein
VHFEAETVLIQGTCRGIPEFVERLRGIAEAASPPDQGPKRLYDRSVLRVIALADA